MDGQDNESKQRDLPEVSLRDRDLLDRQLSL